MKKNILVLILEILVCEILPAQNKIDLNAVNAKDTISKNICGHFAEDIGHCICGDFMWVREIKKSPTKMVPPG